ncbi:MAG: hypothetical protein COA59_17490 [Colwellia sp.]|jgi:hypothetical protein|nr:MAG: hypothetical protein COA59_17490 [Colwellia sp.]
MEIKNSDIESFSELNEAIKAMDSALEKVNRNLEHYELEKIDIGKGSGSLEKQFRKEPEGYGAFSTFDEFFQKALILKEKVGSYTGTHSEQWNVEKEKKKDTFQLTLVNDKATRKAERRDMWTLWFQKLIRWTLGAIVAILLYSGVVWVADNTSFIKVPIKDWIPKYSAVK